MTKVLQPPEAISLIRALTPNTIQDWTTEKWVLNILHTTLLPFYKRIRKILTLRSLYKGKYGVRGFIDIIERVSILYNIFSNTLLISLPKKDEFIPYQIFLHSEMPYNKTTYSLLLYRKLLFGKNKTYDSYYELLYVLITRTTPKTVKFIKESPKEVESSG